jgi:serralysin
MPVSHGTTANDTLTGTERRDTLYGYNGGDRLEGGAGNDLVEFEALGWQGRGTTTPQVTLSIQLGAGNDMANSDGDRVTITGEAGADRLVFLKPDLGATGRITDFFGEEGDIIDLRALAPGLLAWRGDLAFTGTASEVRVAWCWSMQTAMASRI